MAMSSVTVAAPAAKVEEPEWSESRHHMHRKRFVFTKTETVIAYVDLKGNPLPMASQVIDAPSNLQILSSSTALNTAPVQPPLQPAHEGESASSPTDSSESSSPESVPASSIDDADTAPQLKSAPWEDGKYDCSKFPSHVPQIVELNYLGHQGFTGIYDPITGASRDECLDGMYCSYACKPGWSKSQWPGWQPGNGVSVGGLLCKNGKLHRTNERYADLCIPQPDMLVAVNELEDVVSVCQTDYPGLEEMNIPTALWHGVRTQLTCIELAGYYIWQGLKTTAQFYVNNAGVMPEDGCIWGEPDGNIGNWSPLVAGAGFNGEVAFISLSKNPNNREGANFNAEIIADDDSEVNGKCEYVGRHVIPGGHFSGPNADGCTVAVTYGRAKIRIF